MARNARPKGAPVLLLLSASVVLMGVGCAARVTTDGQGGGSIELGPANDGGNATVTTGSDLTDGTSDASWPHPELRRISRLWAAGSYSAAIKAVIDLSREMNARKGKSRLSAGSAGYRQRTDLYDPDQGDGYAEKNLADTHRRARAAWQEEFE